MRRQIEHASVTLQGVNPALYRDLALYLQVLREHLPDAVEKALFHLATRLHPRRYCELPADRRRGLHERAAALVRQAGSLFTVEQLVQLAAALASGRQQRQQAWLTQLRAVAADSDHDAGAGAAGEADGSVRLSLAPPVAMTWWRGHEAWPAGGDRGEAPGGDPPDPSPDDGPDQAADPFAEIPAGHLREGAPPLWDSGLLPREPVELLTWLDGIERALARRLLDLSHGLNAELLRAGLSHSLLPLNLLEAALSGQLEQLAAPANLLRLQLPVPDPLAGSLESVALLLRTADLELDYPRLRTCRSRLQRHRQEVRRMAERHRRLRRRLQALEAEQLWRQDNPRYRQL
ncbi:hypothetical protein [Cyanobium sp. CH-040]|uniref:hypothetical protein n=1 Tax=Cyanobium sp. CH-040 TaxID=2823708 RepID=UPI0020CC4F91|nr:hypothetical protein [Cyanobium sp. CH-040]MCP9926913.1 hypothetical protein [Cyanobium sp. CH-040]